MRAFLTSVATLYKAFWKQQRVKSMGTTNARFCVFVSCCAFSFRVVRVVASAFVYYLSRLRFIISLVSNCPSPSFTLPFPYTVRVMRS
jgi:hypothetical protein